MSANIREIIVEPNTHIIEQLEDLLAEAKSGNLVELGGAAMRKDCTTIIFDSGYRSSVITMYGALSEAALSYREKHLT